MGDLPDWVQATDNAGTIIANTTIPAGTATTIDTSNTGSVLIRFATTGISQLLDMELTWGTSAQAFATMFSQYVTCPALAAQLGFTVWEFPAYGGGLQITNRGAQLAGFTAFAAARVVTAARVLQTAGPSRILANNSSFVSGTGVTLTAADGYGDSYANNGQSTLVLSSNTAGTFSYEYVDSGGNLRPVTLANVAASSTTYVTAGLPQGQLIFQFTPAANNVNGGVNIVAAAAQI